MEKRQTTANSNTLTDAQERLVEALLQFPTIKAAAESVKIPYRTARHYLTFPHVEAAYEQAKQELKTETRNSLVGLASKAVAGLFEMIDDKDCPAPTRLKAYLYAIDRGLPVETTPLQGEDAQERHALLNYLTREELEVYGQVEKGMQAILENARKRQAQNATAGSQPSQRQEPTQTDD